MSLGWPALIAALLLLGLLLWLLASNRKRESGLPSGAIVYADRQTWQRQEEPLYARGLRLAGRPDYLVREPDGGIVPVELKSGPAPPAPHESHVLQLAAYCALVDEVYGVRPGYGILQYRDKAFAVSYTRALEDDLLYVLGDMRATAAEGEADRDHDLWRRCASCGHNAHCGQSLA